MVEIQETTPPDDRTTERRHDLRHRYASVKIREGVPVTDLAAQLGRAKKSMTLDTYSHVMIDEGPDGSLRSIS